MSGGQRDDDDDHEEVARESFANLAGDDGEIDAYELKNILDSVFKRGIRTPVASINGCEIYKTRIILCSSLEFSIGNTTTRINGFWFLLLFLLSA